MSEHPASLVDLALEPVQRALSVVIPGRRWFRGKARSAERWTLTAAIPLPREGERIWVAIVHVTYADGGDEEYVLPVARLGTERAADVRRDHPHLVLADTPDGGAFIDALGDVDVLRRLLPLVAADAVVAHWGAVLRFRTVGGSLTNSDAVPHPLQAEQSNTSVLFGQSYVLKVVRKLDDGVSADLEMGEFLRSAGFEHAPLLVGAIDLARDGEEPATVGILHQYVANRGDAWSHFLERLASYLEAASPAEAEKLLVEDTRRLGILATRIASMHHALASRPDLPSFAPEPITGADRADLANAVRGSLVSALTSLASSEATLPAGAASLAARVQRHRSDLEARLAAFAAREVGASKTRVHGDLHLGQILVTDDDFMLIDFEGEPARSLAERKMKRSPLVDVAGVLRSLHYAAVSAARARSTRAGGQAAAAWFDRTSAAWFDRTSAAFLDAWFGAVSGASFVPGDPEDARRVLDFHLLEKCVYEVHYELNNRPDWLAIPLSGLTRLIEGTHAP